MIISAKNSKDLSFALDGTTIGIGAGASGDICIPLSQESAAPKSAVLFDWPGEYEARGVLCTVFSFAGGLAAKMMIDGASFCIATELSAGLSSAEEEALGSVDGLVIDGSFAKMDEKQSKKIIEQIEPRLVIVVGDALAAEKLGHSGATAEKLLKIKKTDLPSDRMELRVLAVG